MARMDRDRLAPYLFGMLGPRWPEFNYAELAESGWQDLSRLAGEYRLQPLLHARLERGDCQIQPPEPIRALWRTAHRDSALLALAQRTEMFQVVERLRAAGIETLALKGAWLAWYAYPAAAERPMRDIDLLVLEDKAVAAWQLLREDGFVQSDPAARPAEAMRGEVKHLPPLTSPTGIEFELHQFAWEPASEIHWSMPHYSESFFTEDAVSGEAGDPARYPEPHRMLAHLIVHGAYSHRFDVGPQLLVDIDHLLSRADIRWPIFWQFAERDGLERGAALVLALVDRWQRPGLLQESLCPIEPSERAIDDAQSLMLQDYGTRKDAALGSDILSRGTQALGRLIGSNRPRQTPEDEASGESFAHWIVRRGYEAASSMSRTEIRNTARRHARIGQWLDSGET